MKIASLATLYATSGYVMRCIVQNFVPNSKMLQVHVQKYIHAPEAFTVGYKSFVHAPEAFTVGYKILTFFQVFQFKVKIPSKKTN